MEAQNMSTTLVTKESVTRKWYVLDAAGKPMGKTAALAADLLRGKLKTDYTPNVDCGDYVIIVNAKDAVLTGKKLEQKYYRTHSGYPGGLKENLKLIDDKSAFVRDVAMKVKFACSDEEIKQGLFMLAAIDEKEWDNDDWDAFMAGNKELNI